MKGFAKEFKEFITKGNAVSMAIGIIIGGAFTTIVNSIVEQIISPLIGVICGGIDFSSLAIVVGEASFGVGIVINAIITFFLTALVLFLILKGVNSVQAKTEEMNKAISKKLGTAEEEPEPEPEAEPEPSDEAKLLRELIDVMKENKKKE